MKMGNTHSKNMHLHTEREGAFFPRNALNEIRQRYNFAREYCKNKKVLEVGPGTGIASNQIMKLSKEYMCVEYSKENYNIFKNKFPNIDIVNSDFIEVDLKNKNFDTIISMANIYYFDFTKFLSRCSKYLIKNGKLVFCTTNISHEDFNPAPFSTRYYTLTEMRKIMINNGFEATFYGTFKTNNSKELRDIFSKLSNLVIPKFLIYYLKILLRRTIPLPNDFNYNNVSNQKLEIDLVNNDDESKKYIVLYCVAKKV